MKCFQRAVLVVFAILLVTFHSTTIAFEFSMFGSVAINSGDEDHQNFSLGALELIAEHNLSEQTHIVTDLLIRSTHDGMETDLVRYSINRTFNNMFTVGIGRFMQPLGFWNHNFSHGSLAQHTVTRPYIIDIEHHDFRIVPTHLIGMLVRGENETFSYQLSIANADGIRTQNAAIDTGPAHTHSLNGDAPADDISTVLRLTYRILDSFEMGLLIGKHNFVELDENNGLVERGEVLFEQNFVSLDFNYNTPSWYLFGEYFLIEYDDNKDLSGTTVAANPDSYEGAFYYLQAGYRFTDKLTMVLRYESLEIDDNATFFEIQNQVPQTRSVFAINYATEPSNSLRFQVTEVDPELGNGDTIYYLQWFFYML